MSDLLFLMPLLPLLGFVILAGVGKRLPRWVVSSIGVGSVTLSSVVAVGLAAPMVFGAAEPVSQTLWTWIDVGGFQPEIALHFDQLAAVMTLVVTGVGALIHGYSTEFMAGEKGYSRFFAYMNLFVAAMLLLVLADDLLLLYLGWEGVGLCSYLLIGFWYRNPENGRAARKAFVVTRVGDAAMALALFWLVMEFGTLDIAAVLSGAQAQWTAGSTTAVGIAGLLLAGAVGKSAQLPLQTWLPDAMAGPTPVSALIHAATMVTAGVYLIARTHTIFEMAPAVLAMVGVIGAITLVLAGFAALAQRDIKRVLAYSTISQIGYMFVALGIGAWSAAIFHLMTHAFFKALLFLGAGSVILATGGEHDIFEMGGLREKLPTTFWTFVIASLSLAGFPLVTAGFYSKDLILWRAWTADGGPDWLWGAGMLGAVLTGAYIFRVVFCVFFGDAETDVEEIPGLWIRVPLVVLAVLSVVGGFVEIPATLGGWHGFTGFLSDALPAAAPSEAALGTEITAQSLAAVASLGGIAIAYVFYLRRPEWSERLASGPGSYLQRLWRSGWGFDWLYDLLLVRPFVAIARINREDVFDWLVEQIADYIERVHHALRQTQTGYLRLYAAAMVIGAIFVLAGVIWL